MNKQLDTGTDTATPQAIPRPIIPLARDGGLGYDDIERNPSDTLQIQVGPSSDFRVNDTLAIVWGADETQVAEHTLTAEDVRTIVNLYAPVAAIHRIGEGSLPVIARLYSALSPGTFLDSPAETVRVKFSRPGGTDPRPDTPYLNENLPTPVIAPDPIPDDLQGVTVTVRPYENMAAGDEITVSWGGEFITYGPLNPGEIGRDVIIAIPPETLRAAGGGLVPITYEIFDVVHNWSLSAPYQDRDVPIEDPDAPPAPWVDGTTGDKQTELDLAAIGSADIIVQPTDYGGKAGDGVTVHWRGTTAANQPTEYNTAEQILVVQGQPLKFTVPNAEATKLAQGRAQVTYTLRRGVVEAESRRRRLSVVGDLVALTPPRVLEAVRDTLDPADTAAGATVQIVPWPGIAVGDLCTLEWVGTRANGEATHYSDEQYVTGGTIGRGLEFIVETDEVNRLVNGSVRIFYTVDTLGTARSARGAIRQILARLESPALTLQVRKAAGSQPLPAPVVREAVDGVLDPDKHRTAHLDIPTSSEIQKDDRIDATVTGGTQPFSDWVSVTDPAKPPFFLLPATFVSGNRDQHLVASYKLSRGRDSWSSESYKFDIGVVSVALPAPTVDEAPSGTLAPLDAVNGVSIRIRADLKADDIIRAYFGTYSSEAVPWTPGLVIHVPPSEVAKCLGKNIPVSYTVNAERTSEILRLEVEAFADEDSSLPAPTIVEAVGDRLDITSFSGDAHNLIARWPLIEAGQRVWLQIDGKDAGVAPKSLVLLTAYSISAAEAHEGIRTVVPRAEIEGFMSGTPITARAWVAFDGSSNKADAILFPATIYTLVKSQPLSASAGKPNPGLGSLIIVAVSGGTPPYSFQATDDRMLRPDDSRQPSWFRAWREGAASIIVRDSTGDSVTLQLTIVHHENLVKTQPHALYFTSVGQTLTMAVNGGSPPYTFTLSQGGSYYRLNYSSGYTISATLIATPPSNFMPAVVYSTDRVGGGDHWQMSYLFYDN